LRETLIAQPDMQRWEELLSRYADVQIELSKHLPQIENLNIPNCSLARLPQLYQSILEQQDWFRIDMENGITAAQYQKLNALLPVIKAKCEQLASYNLPESIHHGDLHDGNIFYNNGQYIFFDWSDSTITHPFFSLRTAYVSAEIRFNLEENAPILNRLRDAYLIPWREFESEERLLEAFGLAQELWAISSTINWYATISHLDKSLQPEYAHILPSLAQELLSLIKES
jgi:aminoglycoside phosphotransferase (APT) family kinase protein